MIEARISSLDSPCLRNRANRRLLLAASANPSTAQIAAKARVPSVRLRCVMASELASNRLAIYPFLSAFRFFIAS